MYDGTESASSYPYPHSISQLPTTYIAVGGWLCANLTDVAGLLCTPTTTTTATTAGCKQIKRQARHNKYSGDCLNQIYETLMSKVVKE